MSNGFIVAEDNALKELIKGVKVKDNKSQDRDVKVWFGFPDVEIRDQSFPFITIDLIDILPANNRQSYGYLTDDDYQGTIAPQEGYTYTYTIPVAYDLVYQVTSWARHPRHDRAIMHQLLTKLPSKYGYLLVPNELGTEDSSRSMFLDGFVKRDTVDSETGNRRLLRNVFSVRVVSQMTPIQAATAIRQVEEVRINNTTQFIPSELSPVAPIVVNQN